MSTTLSSNLSSPLSTACWSYSDFATADSVTLTTANVLVAWTGGTLDALAGPGSYDSGTGLYTVATTGLYQINFDCLFAATLATGAEQQVGISIDGGTSYSGRLFRTRVEATNTTKVLVVASGIALPLAAGSTIGFYASSDTASDTAEIFAASVMLQRIPELRGTAI